MPFNIDLSAELTFQAVRSSGAGGQNVNKVATKIELRFHVQNSQLLTEEQKAIILEKLTNKINQEGYLIITSQETRSQLKNRELAIEKLYKLLDKAFFVPKKRKATKPSQAAKEERLKSKKIESEKKANRGKIDY